LNINDVNLEAGTVYIRPYGTGDKTHSRTIAIGKNAKKAIWRYLNTRDDPKESPLFITENGQRITRNSVRLLLGELGKRAGVPNTHPHRFRHTAAVFFLRNGGNAFSLQEMLGHSSLDMV
jgi:integrase/recombinase XerD